jgi:hypothetical protein
LVEVFFVVFLLGLFLLLIANEEIKNQNAKQSKVLCIRHVWRRKDSLGWLPENCEDLERIQGAPLTCAVCYTQPRGD